MNNIRFNYLYRDSGNYKKWGNVVFSNPDELDPHVAAEIFHHAFMQECLFITRQVRIPDCFLFTEGNATADDHCFHEFDTIELTTETPNDRHSRSIAEFIVEVSRAAISGWSAFDPHDGLVKRRSAWAVRVRPLA